MEQGRRQHGGHNKILRPEQDSALIQYAAGHCLNRGKDATKQMMYNCAMWFRVQEARRLLHGNGSRTGLEVP